MTETASPTSSEPTALQSDAQADLERALDRLPFAAHLSFEPLFRQLDQTLAGTENARCSAVRPLVEQVKQIPELRGAITAPEVVQAHRDDIRVLLSFVFPDLTRDEMPGRAWAPFAPRAFFATPKYREIFGQEDLEIASVNLHKNRDFYRENLHAAYWLLYRRDFGDPPHHAEFTKRVHNTTTGLDRFFLLNYNYRFVEIEAPHVQVLPEAEFRRLLMMDDVDELARRMPLDGVVFSGFCFQTYQEVSDLQNVSLLKSDLVEPDAFTTPERFDKILRRIRSLLQLPDLEVGMTLRFRNMNEHRYCMMRSVVKDYDACLASIDETIYGEVLRDKTQILIPDLDETTCGSAVVAHMRGQGLRSLCLLPLQEGDEVIGLLELATPRPEELNSWTAKKVADLLPALTVAARRLQHEVATRIESTIKRHCTAVHPSVEWRFEDAAYRYNHEVEATGSATFEDIVFEDVHPLYGAVDIRGSSHSRSRAIQTDLLEQLDLARGTLGDIFANHPMPIADYYDSVLGRYRVTVADGLRSGDEISVIEFLRTRVEPFFRYVQEEVPLATDDGGRDPVDAYFARLDEKLGILYEERKAYEASVALINDSLSEFLDREEEKAQAIFPHYFERYKTDGVEHDIYVGQSMACDRKFDEVQLQNLRLWQLRLMCEMTRLAESLIPMMTVPLETTPLVLVQSSPLTIQFSADEKKFAVEGSYNIRYQIIKKRIDKSTIRGTGERLTQPGHLAVIYSHDKEHEEYRRYFEYLADKGCLDPEIESLELEDLPGVSGLRALRAKVVLD